MTASTPSSISRYGPAVLFLTGLSAGYGIYLIYNLVQTPTPNDGLQRSNAIRRRRPRDSPRTPALPLNERHIPALGEFEILGIQVPLDPNNLIRPHELHAMVTTQPNISHDTVRNAIEHLYDEFFDRLLALLYPDQPLSWSDTNALQEWLNDRNPVSYTHL